MAEEAERVWAEAVQMTQEQIAQQLIDTWRWARYNDTETEIVTSLGWTCSSEVAKSQDVAHVAKNMKKIA